MSVINESPVREFCDSISSLKDPQGRGYDNRSSRPLAA